VLTLKGTQKCVYHGGVYDVFASEFSSSLKERSWKENKLRANARLLCPLSIEINFTDLFGPQCADNVLHENCLNLVFKAVVILRTQFLFPLLLSLQNALCDMRFYSAV
jgi:hypothetical protein